jgi:hypothetical protein
MLCSQSIRQKFKSYQQILKYYISVVKIKDLGKYPEKVQIKTKMKEEISLKPKTSNYHDESVMWYSIEILGLWKGRVCLPLTYQIRSTEVVSLDPIEGKRDFSV